MNKTKFHTQLVLLPLLFLATITAFSQNENRIQFKIKGEINIVDDSEIKLEFFNKEGELIKYVTKVKNEKFELVGTIKDSSAILMKLYGNVNSRDDGDPNSINFFMDPGVVCIKLKEGKFKNAIIKGSESELIHKTYLDILEIEKSRTENDSIEKFNNRFQLISAYPNSSVSALVVLNEVSTENSLYHIKTLFNLLSEKAKKSTYGTTISNKIQSIERHTTGAKVYSFKGIDTSGNIVEIVSFDSDITIIDFWATWCKPCIENFPILKEIQNKYSDKTITVITSSSDFDFNKWKLAIDKYKINTWINLYDKRTQSEKIRISKSEMAEYFGISSLPTSILINKQGQIIGRYGGFGGSPIEGLHDKILEALHEFQ
jgi:thiol-disulfide isomerase/thioredoxin